MTKKTDVYGEGSNIMWPYGLNADRCTIDFVTGNFDEEFWMKESPSRSMIRKKASITSGSNCIFSCLRTSS
ncbi:MAG: hypothetical protein ACXACH_03660, partial [Candidatus Hermodarchaeia archaeon]